MDVSRVGFDDLDKIELVEFMPNGRPLGELNWDELDLGRLEFDELGFIGFGLDFDDFFSDGLDLAPPFGTGKRMPRRSH